MHKYSKCDYMLSLSLSSITCPFIFLINVLFSFGFETLPVDIKTHHKPQFCCMCNADLRSSSKEYHQLPSKTLIRKSVSTLIISFYSLNYILSSIMYILVTYSVCRHCKYLGLLSKFNLQEGLKSIYRDIQCT